MIFNSNELIIKWIFELMIIFKKEEDIGIYKFYRLSNW